MILLTTTPTIPTSQMSPPLPLNLQLLTASHQRAETTFRESRAHSPSLRQPLSTFPARLSTLTQLTSRTLHQNAPYRTLPRRSQALALSRRLNDESRQNSHQHTTATFFLKETLSHPISPHSLRQNSQSCKLRHSCANNLSLLHNMLLHRRLLLHLRMSW
jgi:hypothetical protein